MKKVSPNSVGLALLCISFTVQADYELLKGQYGSLQFTFNAETAAFAENNPWFGKARENIGDPANFWWEGSTETGVKGSLNFFGGSQLYGVYILSACEFLASRCACLMADRSFFVEGKAKKCRCSHSTARFFNAAIGKKRHIEVLKN